MTKPVAVFRSGVIGDPRHTIRLDGHPFGAISLFQPVYHIVYHLMGDIIHMASGGI
jgi:hypothetical protein